MTEIAHEFTQLMTEARIKFEIRCKYFDLWMKALDTVTAVGELEQTAMFSSTRIHKLFMTSASIAEEFYSLYKEANDAHMEASKQQGDYMNTLKMGGKNASPS